MKPTNLLFCFRVLQLQPDVHAAVLIVRVLSDDEIARHATEYVRRDTQPLCNDLLGQVMHAHAVVAIDDVVETRLLRHF